MVAYDVTTIVRDGVVHVDPMPLTLRGVTQL